MWMDPKSPFPDEPFFDCQDWWNFVEAQPPLRPATPSPEAFKQMSKAARKDSCNDRRAYISSFNPIVTTSLKLALEDLLLLANSNMHIGQGVVRNGAVITGLVTVGKTTFMRELGKIYERRLRALLKAQQGDGWLLQPQPRDERVLRDGKLFFTPVIVITLRGSTTVKGMYQGMARFLQIPDWADLSESKLRAQILEQAHRRRTSLILVDDIHSISPQFKGTPQINNEFKSLMSETSATFVYAGIDCDNAGLFSEFFDPSARSQKKLRTEGKPLPAINRATSQTNHRFSRIELTAFNKANKNLDEAERFLQSIDNNLTLVHHTPGDLVRMSQYVLDRTDGYIGAIRNLVRLGAQIAIIKGQEKLSVTLLDAIKLDNAAETQWKLRKKSTEEAGKP
jgi:AAA domain